MIYLWLIGEFGHFWITALVFAARICCYCGVFWTPNWNETFVRPYLKKEKGKPTQDSAEGQGEWGSCFAAHKII